MANKGIQGSRKPSLSTAIVNGELQHVLTIKGAPFQRFTKLSAALCALTLALAGCQTRDQKLSAQIEADYYVALWCDAEYVAQPGDAQKAAAYAKRTKLVCR